MADGGEDQLLKWVGVSGLGGEGRGGRVERTKQMNIQVEPAMRDLRRP